VLAGAWNGLLVAGFGIQPIIATLVLMVAGRGIAQLITEGQIINFLDPTMVYLGNGHLFALPFTVTLVLVMLALALFLVRRTALGLFIESVGDNYEASRYSGVNAIQVKFLVYTFSGLCAGLAGLVACSNIKSADANNIGLYLELDAILAVVVGGTSLQGGRFYIVGAVVGALFIQTLTTTLYARNVSSDVSPVPKALVIIAVCLFESDLFRARLAQLFRPLGRVLRPLSSRLPHKLFTAPRHDAPKP
jgi:ribose/xylose/arabinose/galactoside ABC-type transport system permease subunit